MKVILLKDVPKVGKKYDIKDVADGFALNLLIPRKLAERASPQAVAQIGQVKVAEMAEKKIQEDLLAMNLETIKNLTLTIKEKANDKGHLFAGVTKEVLVAEILKATRLNLDTGFLDLDKPLKSVGEHKVTVEAGGKKVQFTVVIEAL